MLSSGWRGGASEPRAAIQGNSEVESTHREPARPCQSLNVSPRATPRVRSRLSYPPEDQEFCPQGGLRAKCMVQKIKNLIWIQLASANEDASGGAGF